MKKASKIYITNLTVRRPRPRYCPVKTEFLKQLLLKLVSMLFPKKEICTFSNFSCRFLNPKYFFQFEFELFQFIRSIPSRDKLKSILLQKSFWPFNIWINYSSYLKYFANSRPSASNFKSLSRSQEQFL